MSDDLTPRDVIAQFLSGPGYVTLWSQKRAEDLASKLDAAGWSITKKVDEA